MTERFWMVQGDGPAWYRHLSLDSAEKEAKRLARAHPETEFYVMEAVSMHKKIDVVSVNLRAKQGDISDFDIPF